MVKKKARRRLCTVYCMHTTRSPVWLLGGLLGGTAPAFDYILTNSLHIYHVEPRNFPAPIMPSPATQTTDAGIGRVFRDTTSWEAEREADPSITKIGRARYSEYLPLQQPHHPLYHHS